MKIEDLNLSALKYFLDAVKHQSLTRSAEINFVTRPAVSLAIRRLEGWAGQPFLTHKKNSFELTRSGQDFYRKMLPVFEHLKGSVENRSSVGGPLRIGCSASLVDPFLLPALKSHKDLSGLNLSTGRSNDLVRQLDEGEIGMAILIGERPKWSNSKTIYKGDFVLCSKSGELGRLIVTTEPRAEVVELQKVLRDKNVEEFDFLRVESWSICLKFASTLNASCLIPDFLATGFKRVRGIPLKHPYQVSLIHRNLEHLSENEKKLMDIIVRRKEI